MIINASSLSAGLKIISESIEGWDSPVFYIIIFGLVGLMWFGFISVITIIGILLSKIWQKRQIMKGGLIKSSDSVSRIIIKFFIVCISVIFYWLIGYFLFEVFNLTSISQRDELIIFPFVLSSITFAALVHYSLCKRTMKPIIKHT